MENKEVNSNIGFHFISLLYGIALSIIFYILTIAYVFLAPSKYKERILKNDK